MNSFERLPGSWTHAYRYYRYGTSGRVDNRVSLRLTSADYIASAPRAYDADGRELPGMPGSRMTLGHRDSLALVSLRLTRLSTLPLVPYR